MAFKMDGESVLPAGREVVWTHLNDPETLKACIPGCQELEQKENGGFSAVVKVKVGLTEQDGGTLLRYDVDAVIGGRLAQLGGRLVNGVAKKLADEFFAKFAQLIEERHGQAAA